MSATITAVKQGDLFPDVETIVKDELGAVLDVTGCSLVFSMRNARDPSSVPVSIQSGVVVDGPTGSIAYRWKAGETDTPGTYEGEFKITPPAGDAYRLPTDGYIIVVIGSKVA